MDMQKAGDEVNYQNGRGPFKGTDHDPVGEMADEEIANAANEVLTRRGDFEVPVDETGGRVSAREAIDTADADAKRWQEYRECMIGG